MSVIEKYVEANSSYQSAKADLQNMADRIKEFADHFASLPGHACFSSPASALPLDVILSPLTKTFQYSIWRDPEEIHQAVLRQYNARQAALAAWAAVPNHQREFLIPPDPQ